MVKKKILITGGTGFIGYHLAKKCLDLNWQVTSLSKYKPKKKRIHKKVKYIFCDISNKKKLSKIITTKYTYVVNLAGYVDHSHKLKTYKSHYIGCKNLADIFLNSDIKKFVQVGSCIEYGKIRSPQVEKKINKQKTYSIYGKSKLLSTKLLIGYFKKKNFPATILRLYLVYGPHQDKNRVIPITIINALKNSSFRCSSGIQFRDFTYIDDVINSIIKALKHKNTNGEIINIGSGKPIQVKYLINLICKFIKKGKPIFGKIQLRKDEILRLYPNIKKAKKLLRWTPKTNLKSGLLKTIRFYSSIKKVKYFKNYT